VSAARARAGGALVGALLSLLLAAAAPAQGAGDARGAAPGQRDTAARGPKPPRPPTRFFDTEEPLAVTFAADLDRLRRDRSDKAPWRPARLSYTAPDGQAVTLPVRARTRGIWRLKTCAFPPLRLDFAGKSARGTVFEGLDKPKVVNYCRDNDLHEQYVLQELQLYRVYAVLTPAAHRVRLLRVTYVDSVRARTATTRYAILLEEPKALAARLGGRLEEAKGASAGDFEPFNAALVGVFQYMIGNVDWSAAHLHNAEIVRDSTFTYLLVPYDFDYAGAVNAQYAVPDPRLNLASVRQRLFRGHCAPPEAFAQVAALFRAKKDAIYALYRDPVGRLLRPQLARETLAYFDEFYRILESPASVRREFVDACVRAQ
jgi:hypothetical protein